MARAHVEAEVRARGRRIKGGEGELSIRVQMAGILKRQSFPSNVAGEKRLYLPEGSKASFVGGFSLAALRFCLFVRGGGKKTHRCDDKKERGAAACWHLCRFCLLF